MNQFDFDRFERLMLRLDETPHDAPEFASLVVEAMAIAPPELQRNFRAIFQETFGIQPAGYDDEGDPCYRIDQLAGVLGVPLGEAEEQIRALGLTAMDLDGQQRIQ